LHHSNSTFIEFSSSLLLEYGRKSIPDASKSFLAKYSVTPSTAVIAQHRTLFEFELTKEGKNTQTGAKPNFCKL